MSHQAPSLPILPQLIETLRSARYVVVLTGAGVSAESRIPTFREAQTGLWAKYSPEELATPQAFRRNPKLVWEWYTWRREVAAQAKPNPGHLALAELEQRMPQFTLITQNVDGLHQRAGSRHIIELHGNINRTKCFDEGNIIDS
ncbi:MAG: NAD-dependent protein deacylase, partial [Anaerolineae bacterium]|nr:NAD-dependent protein deacylase [Anaerolineae bacterium]